MEKGTDKAILFLVRKLSPCSNSSPLNFFLLKKNPQRTVISAQDSKNKKAFAFEPFSILASSKALQGNRLVQSGDGWFGRKDSLSSTVFLRQLSVKVHSWLSKAKGNFTQVVHRSTNSLRGNHAHKPH